MGLRNTHLGVALQGRPSFRPHPSILPRKCGSEICPSAEWPLEKLQCDGRRRRSISEIGGRSLMTSREQGFDGMLQDYVGPNRRFI